jgi:hypothetical protein
MMTTNTSTMDNDLEAYTGDNNAKIGTLGRVELNKL